MEGSQEMTQVISTFANVGGQLIPFSIKTSLDLSEKLVKLLALLGSKSFGLGAKVVKGTVRIKTGHKFKEFKLKRKGLTSIQKLMATKGEDIGFVRIPEGKVEEFIAAIKKRGGKISALEDLNLKDGKVEFAYHVSDAAKIESALEYIKAGEIITKEEYLNNADEEIVNEKFEEAKTYELKNVKSPVKEKTETKYFDGCRSEQELSKRFHALVKIYHPEQGSSDATIYQKVVEEYKQVKEKFAIKKDSNLRVVVVPSVILEQFLKKAKEKNIDISIMQGEDLQNGAPEVSLSYNKKDVGKVESVYNEVVPADKKVHMDFEDNISGDPNYQEASGKDAKQNKAEPSKSARQFEKNNKVSKDTKQYTLITINAEKLVMDKKEDIIFTKIPGTKGQEFINFRASDVKEMDGGKTLAIKVHKNQDYPVMNKKGEVIDKRSGVDIKKHYDDVLRNLKKATATTKIKTQSKESKVKSNPTK